MRWIGRAGAPHKRCASVRSFHCFSKRTEAQRRGTEPRNARIPSSFGDCASIVRDAARGLSMNTGFLPLNTCFACSRWTRPSTLSSSTASTFVRRVGISGTISTLYLVCNSSANLSTRVRLDSISGLPPLYAATIRAPDNFAGAPGVLSTLANAVTCEVSVPTIPIRRSAEYAERAARMRGKFAAFLQRTSYS